MIENIGKRIKMIRSYYELTQSDLAKKLHTTQKSISRYELNTNLPDFEFLYHLTTILNVNPLWFLTGEGDMIRETHPHPQNDYETEEIVQVIESDRILKAIVYAMLVDHPVEEKLNEQWDLLKTVLKLKE